MGTVSTSGHRPSPAMVVAMLALFVALGGTAWGLAKNSVRSKHIVDGQVRSVDVADDTTINALGTSDLATGAVTGPDVLDGGLTADDLGENSVGSSELQSITGADVTDDSLSGSDISESSLGQVPAASNAGTLDNLDSSAFSRAPSGPVYVRRFAISNNVTEGIEAVQLPPGNEVRFDINCGSGPDVYIYAIYGQTPGAVIHAAWTDGTGTPETEYMEEDNWPGGSDFLEIVPSDSNEDDDNVQGTVTYWGSEVVTLTFLAEEIPANASGPDRCWFAGTAVYG